MAGKVLKISSNDLYSNVSDRLVSVYACFEHTKYMNNYVIFSFKDGLKNKLCYGSIHLKKETLVIFNVKENVKQYIDEFLSFYLSDELIGYRILDINNIKKVELISFNEMEYDKIEELDAKSILIEEEEKKDIKENESVFLYILLIFLILLGIGLTILYFIPELFGIEYKVLDCSDIIYDDNIQLNYRINKNIIFDSNDKVNRIKVVRTYAFLDSDSYNNFKDNNMQNKYFTNGESYKYLDNKLVFKLFYDEETVIDDYDEMLVYMKREGYSCIESEYEE